MIIFLVFTLVLPTLLFLMFLFNQQTKFIVFVLKLVSAICDLITLPIYLLIDRPWKIKQPSKIRCSERHYEANGNYYYWKANTNGCSKETLPEEFRVLRSSLQKLTHLSELWTAVEKAYKNKKCFGRRTVLGKKVENDQVRLELSSDYVWKSYKEVLGTSRVFAKILHHKFQLKHRDRVAIFAETSPEYFIMFSALQSLGCEVVLLRSTPNAINIPAVLNEHQIKLLFTQTSLVKLLNELKPNIRTVSKLICFRHLFADEADEEEIRNVKYELFEYDQLVEEGRTLTDLNFVDCSKFSPTDIALIVATSGSTFGVPKSVIVTHANMAAFISGNKVGASNEYTFLAYMEGSLVMELTREVNEQPSASNVPFNLL